MKKALFQPTYFESDTFSYKMKLSFRHKVKEKGFFDTEGLQIKAKKTTYEFIILILHS